MNRTVLLFVVITVLIGAGIGYLMFSRENANPQAQQTSGISGTISVNGVVPQGATLTLLQKNANGDGSLTPFSEGIAVSDQMEWRFANAQQGTTYEIQAVVMQNGTELSHSAPIYVTAPAENELLSLNVTSDTATENATIAGVVGINGYLPTGATITIQERLHDAADFENVLEGLAAKDGQAFAYTTAASGKMYDFRAVLYDANGNEIGRSSVVDITAPAKNEELHINSTAKPPVVQQAATPTPAKSSVSGTINFNGSALPNSRIVILQRLSNTNNNFQVAIDNITPVNGTSWQWTGANVSTWYDMVAVLKQRQSDGTDKDINTSSTITVAAPASGESFTLNSGYSLSAPTGSITVTCGSKNTSNNTWPATIFFQQVPNAQSYWFQIGTSNGGSEFLNTAQNAQNNSNATQSVSANLSDGVAYYARYAYSLVSGMNVGSPQFSAFSGTTQVRCSG